MEYGCIGERLVHSFSKEIHNALDSYPYELCEVTRDGLDAFMTQRDFKAINVTIPYKEKVLPHLSWIDEAAKEIGAVNTVVNRDGKLYGYNTDFYGMRELIRHAGVTLDGKKVAILGTGGTAKTARAVAGSLGASLILTVSRTPKAGEISYDELYRTHSDTEVIINTTPCGMFPNIFTSAVDISGFGKLTGVIDAVYNPLRTTLVLDANERGIPAEGGLYMLVAQAVRASEIFLDVKYGEDVTEKIYEKILKQKESVVLTGMPASGKSTVGAILARELSRELVDTDELIIKRIGMPISEYFQKYGEGEFRERECEVIRELAPQAGLVIATGGGAPLRAENVRNLKRNGRVFFIDRPLESLVPTADRPLALDRAAIEKRYTERYDIYCKTADVRVDADSDALTVAKRIGGTE